MMNVSLPAGAVTPTVHVSGAAVVAGVQFGDAGVRFAVVVTPAVVVVNVAFAGSSVMATDCVFGETNAGARCVDDVPVPDGIVMVNDAVDSVVAPGRLD
jgi:hypothetical protein